jgi:hypothetical protein
MDMDLGLSIDNRYTIALVVFFIPYLLFEVSIRPQLLDLKCMADSVPASVKYCASSSWKRELARRNRSVLGNCDAWPGKVYRSSIYILRQILSNYTRLGFR